MSARHPTKDQDIKGPDGFTLGGLRLVRKDGTVLFGRRWWKCPDEWIGHKVWVHFEDGWGIDLEGAPPGVHIYRARSEKTNILLTETDRPEAKPVYRDPQIKSWIANAAFSVEGSSQFSECVQQISPFSIASTVLDAEPTMSSPGSTVLTSIGAVLAETRIGLELPFKVRSKFDRQS